MTSADSNPTAAPHDHEHRHRRDGHEQVAVTHPPPDGARHDPCGRSGHGVHDGNQGFGDHRHRRGLSGAIRSVFEPHSHDAGDKVDDALTASHDGMRALKVSLIGLLITAVFQIIIVIISGSVALLADTVHNFSDALTAVPIGVAFVVGRRVANRRYTYGYGRAEDIAGLFVLLTMLASALLALYGAVDRLVNQRGIDHVGWVAVAGLVGFAGNELVASYRIRVGNRIGSAALVADGLHARTDGLTSLAVVVGAAGVALGWPLADPIVGLVISAAIFAVLYQAAKEVFGRMMDRIDERLVAAAEASVTAVPGVLALDQLRMRWVGHELFADVDIGADPALDLTGAHDLAHHVRNHLLNDVSRLVDATVHVGPVAPPTAEARHHRCRDEVTSP